jgi:hypothetical protein
LLHAAEQNNTGRRQWALWKAMAAAGLVKLADEAPRMELHELSLSGDFNALYSVRMPVPLLPVNGKLPVAERAFFHLRYEEEWTYQNPPPWGPLGLLDPVNCFHPNVRPGPRAAMCLGNIPPGVTPRELAILGYYALTLQQATLDESDPQGVLNLHACEYFRAHQELMPLTTAGLLDPWEKWEGPAT